MTRFFHKQKFFMSNTRLNLAKSQAKAMHNPEAELLPYKVGRFKWGYMIDNNKMKLNVPQNFPFITSETSNKHDICKFPHQLPND